MRVLLVGSGGREHALATMIGLSPLCTKLFCAPGNAGIAEVAELVPIAQTDLDGLVAFCRQEKIDFVVVGPEDPLVFGLVDRLAEAGIPAFGPSAKAAALEGSKAFTKELCAKYSIPTAAYRRFTKTAPALDYLREKGAPIVIKADGLSAGKGVTVAMTLAEAEAAVRAALDDKAFGQAGAEIVIEEFLEGEEASFFALSDGETVLPLIAAQDHKRAFDNDEGPNTGGMGAYSPTPVMGREMEYRVLDEIIRPTVQAMKAEGRPFKGVLYAGLMIGKEGPKLIEYNVRFGDPECQVLMLRLVSDLLPALIASAKGGLDKIALGWSDEVALLVVMATKGYPGPYGKGSVIKGVEKAGEVAGVKVFHAATKRSEKGELLANGGRVLNVCARASTVQEARAQAYKAIELIDWPGGFYRRDIAWRALAR